MRMHDDVRDALGWAFVLGCWAFVAYALIAIWA